MEKPEITLYKEQYEAFLNETQEARAYSERDQDYDDHHQWTDDEIQELEARGQAPVVMNRVKVKVNLLIGLQRRGRTVPRALPRTPDHTDAADAVSEALRYVSDNTDFPMLSSSVFRDEIVPGYGGAIIECEGKGKPITTTQILWDRYYYDPHCRELDFADKKYDGLVIWMDEDDVIAEWPDKEEAIKNLVTVDNAADETFDDKPVRWVDYSRKRLRICQHFNRIGQDWYMCYFTGDLELTKNAPSPYKDEDGKPQNPIEMQTAYIDRDLNRYGEARAYIWPQDEINHRRSRLLYAGSVNRTIGEDGAVDDIDEMKRELAKANGHVKTNRGFNFELLPNDAISETQIALLQEAKQEIDTIGANPALAGAGRTRSGRQDQIQQNAGMTELASLYDGHKSWEKRVYRQWWNRIKQFWDEEKWVRVTDDPKNLEFVGLNTPITNGDLLLQTAQQGPPELAQAAQAELQQRINDPWMNQVVSTENSVVDLDVDIIISESPDVATLKQETFEMMASLAERYGPENVPFPVMLELMDVPNKDKVKKLLEPDPQQVKQQNAVQQQMRELEIGGKEAEIIAKKAKAQKDSVDAEAQNIENQIATSGFENLVADRDSDTRGKQIDNLQKEIETIKLAEEPVDNVSVSV